MINAVEGVYHIDYQKAKSRMVVGIANEKPGAEQDTGEEVKIEFGLIVIARSHDAPSERCSTGFVSMKNIQPLISNETLVKR